MWKTQTLTIKQYEGASIVTTIGWEWTSAYILYVHSFGFILFNLLPISDKRELPQKPVDRDWHLPQPVSILWPHNKNFIMKILFNSTANLPLVVFIKSFWWYQNKMVIRLKFSGLHSYTNSVLYYINSNSILKWRDEDQGPRCVPLTVINWKAIPEKADPFCKRLLYCVDAGRNKVHMYC